MNFVIDALLQPILTAAIEVTLWMAILSGMAAETLGGFGRGYYLSYALWANFVGRVSSNWFYEYQMIDEIDSGRVNAILVRPISFYEFYLSQFVGYKTLILISSFGIPISLCLFLNTPFEPSRLPLMIALVLCFLVFNHTLSFCVSCAAFHLNRAHALTGMKNLVILVLAGELIPLDLYPEPLRTWLMHSPFAAGVYLPVGYVTGRVGNEVMMQGFVSIALGMALLVPLASMLWKNGVRQYTGTGA